MVTTTPALTYFNHQKPVTLSVGAVLCQENKPVTYASRVLTPNQQKYTQIEKETLTILFGANLYETN